MLRLVLRQARSTAGRLVLAGVAVVLGTGFVAAVLLTSALFTRTVAAAAAAQYSGADLVVDVLDGSPLTDTRLAAVAAAPGVAAVDGRVSSGVELVGAGRSQYVDLSSTTTERYPSAQDGAQLAAGALPGAPGEVAVSASTAERLGVGVGDRLRLRYTPAPTHLGTDDTSTDASTDASTDTSTDVQPVEVPVTVVGTLAGGVGGLLGSSGSALALPADALAWSGSGTYDADGDLVAGYVSALVVAEPGAGLGATGSAVAAALRAAGAGEVRIETVQQRVDDSVDSFVGGTNVLTGIALAFAVLALVVASTVITNTFSVLVAQRTRQLALLRCVGATSRQVLAGVLVEATALGLVASAVGVLGGTALAAAAAAVLADRAAGFPVPGGVVLTPASVLAPLALGVVVTVLAAVVPARAATRVAPLAALRPVAAPDLRRPVSRLRLAASLLLLLGGLVLLVGGTVVASGVLTGQDGGGGLRDGAVEVGLPVAMVGGAASFTGVLLGAVFLVPRVVALLGRALEPVGGAPARLARLNAVRNPRRTASTTSALLIGTTLVALMVVGAATTSRTLGAALDRSYPVDAAVSTVDGSVDGSVDSTVDGSAGTSDAPLTALSPAVVQAATGVQGVASAEVLRTASVTVTTADASGVVLAVLAPTDGDLAAVLAAPSAARGLAPGSALVPLDVAQLLGVSDGDAMTLTTAASQREVRARVGGLGGSGVVLAPQDLDALAPAAVTGALWLRFDPAADAAATAQDLQTAVSDAAGTSADSVPVSVRGMAADRAGYQRLIDTMLLVVVGLLAVAVVIALVGVANTLSLSVIERTRENAVLRALGLTRGQLRRTLALEGALVAGVGGLLGVVLGSLYGWLGAASLLGGLATAGGDAVWTPALPWGRLALLVLVAVVAGLLASVLPARRAVRTPPVAALADQ